MENESADNLLIKILDADTVREKLILIKDNKEKLDARTLGNIAVVFTNYTGKYCLMHIFTFK